MQVIEAINTVDRLKPNMYGAIDKISWLSRLDQRIFEEILLTHELSEEEMEPFIVEEDEEEEPVDPTAWHALELPPPPPPAFQKKLAFDGYTKEDESAELLVKAPYDEMYVHWLSAQIDWNNMEYESFNATNAMFEAVYRQFRNTWNRTHRPLGRKRVYF